MSSQRQRRALLFGVVNQTLQLPDVREAFAKQGLTPAGGPPRRLSDLVAVELSRWIRVVGEAKISED
jgi:tripartite-type tricarboxylate transporter receptor subunit TctC